MKINHPDMRSSDPMPFRINCPKCQTPFVCPDENRGKRMQCSKCGQQFLAGSAPANPAPPPTNPKPQGVQAQPNRPAAPATRRVVPQVPTPNAESPIAVKRSNAGMILVGLAAALIVGLALGSAGTYWIMRGKETAPAASEPEQLAQAKPNAPSEKQNK